MRINKIIFPCTAIALLLIACGKTPEPVVERSQSVVEGSRAASKSQLDIDYQFMPYLSVIKKVVDDIFNSKGKEYASSLKQNCSEEDLKVLEQLNSCVASAQDKAALDKCGEDHKPSKDECRQAAEKIASEVKWAVQAEALRITREETKRITFLAS